MQLQAGTFGVGTGRSRIDTTQNFGTFAGHQARLGPRSSVFQCF